MVTTLRPPALRKRGTVMILAPSSYPSYPRMRLAEGVDFLRKRGFRVMLGDTLSKAVRYRYFSAQDEQRARELESAFSDPKVDAVFCARGGIGSLRILNMIDYDVVRENPKVFVGYSDITGFQMAFLERAGLVTFQGAMPAITVQGEREESRRIFEYNWDLLFRVIVEGEAVELKNPPDSPATKTVVGGKTKGVLTGGNLILFTLLAGSQFDPQTKGRILFLEDIEEDPWRIDEFLAGLLLSNKLQEAGGVVFGEFPEPAKFDLPTPSIEEVLVEYLFKSGEKPSIVNLACCHGKYVLPIALGAEYELDADSQVLSLRSGAVEK